MTRQLTTLTDGRHHRCDSRKVTEFKLQLYFVVFTLLSNCAIIVTIADTCL